MRKKNNPRKRRGLLAGNKGFALIMVLGFMLFMTGLQVSLLTRGIWQSNASRMGHDWANALQLAEAGLNQAAINLVTPTITADDVTAAQLTTGRFEVDPPVQVAATLYSVTTRGISQGQTREVEAFFRLTPQSIFQYALFGNDGIEVTGSAFTDSYDSSAGPYEDTPGPGYNKGRNGDIGTNSSAVGGVEMGGSIFIDGQVAVGEGVANPYSVVTDYDADFITGGTSPPSDYQDVVAQTAEFPMPAVSVPPGLVCSNAKINGNDLVSLAPGSYCYNDLTIEGGGTLTSNGKVTIYITGNLIARGNSTMGTPSDPQNFLVMMTNTSEASVEQGSITGATEFYGAIYAPDATIDITGNAEIYGSIVAKSVDVTGSAAIHYDEDMVDLTDVANTYSARRISWEEQ